MASYRLEELGLEVDIKKYAQQANGSAWLKQGGTIVLATACNAPSKEFPGFLPLTVDYREQFSAAGKIPGGYYKREGRSTDRETLTARLIDRSIRPLFPLNYFDQVQVIANVYSVDKEHIPSSLALLASSIALTVSNIPFLGPVGATEVVRVDGAWVVSPVYSQTVAADVNLTFAGTEEGVCMVEGSANEISEKEFLDALFMAHEVIKKQVNWQKQLKQELNVVEEPIVDEFDWNEWTEKVDAYLTHERLVSIFKSDKVERSEAMNVVKEGFFAHHQGIIDEQELPKSKIEYVLDMRMKDKLTDLIFEQGKRIDGRSFTQVRAIATEVGLLPFAHGSSLFTRGRTQALATVTLGGGEDLLKVEGFMGVDIDNYFFLHYNFPPFSVGEVRFLRGPGRREIGHGHLAASALRRMLPSSDTFPYTIRIVADMLESDGSTSMATTCSGTMALLNAGVPLKKMVSGVAMGLLKSSDGKYQALTDISGFEDAFGLMDFKVTGTSDGITAIQLDIKSKAGLPRSVFEQALAQAKEGREHILNEMRKVMKAPAPELSPLVPKVYTLKVATDKIGAIIGTGGKTIREIIDRTRTQIDIEDDGTVKIFGGPDADVDLAINWVNTLAGNIERGTIYQGKIRRLADFGIFVELVPGVDGLLHISNIPREKQRNFNKEYAIDDIVEVEVVDYDPQSERIRLKFVGKSN